MTVFLRARGASLAVVVLVMLLVSVLQARISYSVERGLLLKLELAALPVILVVLYVLRMALLLLLVTLWVLNRKRALLRTIIVANAYFTLILSLHTIALISVLGGFRQAAQTLLFDAGLMCIVNTLVFSVWYWIIDPRGVEDEPHGEAPWAFLFPQRSLQSFDRWSPEYPDYLFIAFTTSFAFSPTDSLPLTRMAKMLMLLQASIAVVIVLGIAGAAINTLVGG